MPLRAMLRDSTYLSSMQSLDEQTKDIARRQSIFLVVDENAITRMQ